MLAGLLAGPAAGDPLAECDRHVRYGAPSEDEPLLCRLVQRIGRYDGTI